MAWSPRGRVPAVLDPWSDSIAVGVWTLLCGCRMLAQNGFPLQVPPTAFGGWGLFEPCVRL